MGALGSILDEHVRSFYDYLLGEMNKYPQNDERNWLRITVGLKECISVGNQPFHKSSIEHVCQFFIPFFGRIKEVKIMCQIFDCIFAIGLKYHSIFYRSELFSVTLDYLYMWYTSQNIDINDEKPLCKRIIKLNKYVCHGLKKKHYIDSFGLLTVFTNVLKKFFVDSNENRGIGYRLRLLNNSQRSNGSLKTETHFLQASMMESLKSFYCNGAIESRNGHPNASLKRDEILESERVLHEFNESRIEMAESQYLELFLMHLNNIDNAMISVTNRQMGRQQLNCFGGIFESLNSIDPLLYNNKVVDKIHDLLNTFVKIFGKCSRRHKEYQSILNEIYSLIMRLLNKHLSLDILFKYNELSMKKYLECINNLVIECGNCYPATVRNVMNFTHFYDLILSCKTKSKLILLDIVGSSMTQSDNNSETAIALETIVSIIEHIHFLLTPAKYFGKTYQKTSLTHYQREILMSFFLQCLNFVDALSAHYQVCLNVIESLISIIYRMESFEYEIGIKQIANADRFSQTEKVVVSNIFGETEIDIIHKSSYYRKFSFFYKCPCLNIIRNNGQLIQLLLKMFYKLRACDKWKKIANLNSTFSQLTLCLCLLSMNWLPYCAMIDLLIKWVDTLVYRQSNEISISTLDDIAKVFAKLSLFEDVNVRIRVAMSMKEILQDLCQNARLFGHSIIFNLWAKAALSRLNDCEPRVEKSFLKVLEFCGWSMMNNAMLNEFEPLHPNWVVPFMRQLMTLPLSDQFNNDDLKDIVNYFGSKSDSCVSVSVLSRKKKYFINNYYSRDVDNKENIINTIQKQEFELIKQSFRESIDIMFEFDNSSHLTNVIFDNMKFMRKNALLLSLPSRGSKKWKKLFHSNGKSINNNSNLNCGLIEINKIRTPININLRLLSNHVSKSRYLTYYWLSCHVAKYLVFSLSRQTVFGSTKATLDHLKSLISDLPIFTKSKQGDKKDLHHQRAVKHVPWREPFWHYIECLDLFEKLVYNAYEGCINLPALDDIMFGSNNVDNGNEILNNLLKFFVGNRKIFEIWFGRDLRPYLAQSCYEYSVCYEVMIHQSTQSLSYLLTQSKFPKLLKKSKYKVSESHLTYINDMHDYLYHIVFGCMERQDYHAILGIKQTFSKEFAQWDEMARGQGSNKYFDLLWVDGMMYQSKGSMIDAISCYQTFIATHNDCKYYSGSFIQKIDKLLAQCCLDTSNWNLYWQLYSKTKPKSELESKESQESNNTLQMAAQSKEGNVFYTSLCHFDEKEFEKSSQRLKEWQINVETNPLKSESIDTSCSLDLLDVWDKYHLQSLLCGISNNENKRDYVKYCKLLVREPLRLTSHGLVENHYPYLIRMQCARAIEMSDMSVLTPMINYLYFDESHLLHDRSQYNNTMSISRISKIKMRDLKILDRTMVGLKRIAPKKDKFLLYEKWRHLFTRWNVICQNIGIGKKLLNQMISSPAKVFLKNVIFCQDDTLTPTTKVESWLKSVNDCVTDCDFEHESFGLKTAQYQAYCYLEAANVLEMDSITNENCLKLYKQIKSSLSFVLNKSKSDYGNNLLSYYQLQTKQDDSMMMDECVLYLYKQSCNLWKQGSANWHKLGQFSNRISFKLSSNGYSSVDSLMLRQFFVENDNKNEAKVNAETETDADDELEKKEVDNGGKYDSELIKVEKLIIQAMNETTFILNHSGASQDAVSILFAQLRTKLKPFNFNQDQLTKICERTTLRRKAMIECLTIMIESYHKIVLNNKEKTWNKHVSICMDLFGLLCNFGIDLQQDIALIVSQTPSNAWSQLIPQLFSRLGHSHPQTRQEIENLVIRVAHFHPSDVMFPVLSGLSSTSSKNINTSNQSGDAKNETLRIALSRTLAKLKEDKKLCIVLNQVSEMMDELSRISILWEDLWIQHIEEIERMMPSRVRFLEQEIKLVKKHKQKHKRKSKGKAKSPRQQRQQQQQHQQQQNKSDEMSLMVGYRLIMAPILEIFTKLEKTITDIPKTPHESRFQRKYCHMIEDVMKQVRTPNDEQLNNASLHWNQLSTKLYQISHRMIAHKQWRMRDLSPKLASIEASQISVPGMESNVDIESNVHFMSDLSNNDNGNNSRDNVMVLLQSIDDNVQIIKSKTRPKKLTFVGNDGKKYQYLLKSREDLNLDEKMMQFLKLVNNTLTNHCFSLTNNNNDNSSKDDNASQFLSYNNLRARLYQIVPLDKKTGLIRFVDHATPLMQIYRAWQDRYGKEIDNETKEKVLKREKYYNDKQRGTGIDAFRYLLRKQLKETDGINIDIKNSMISRHKASDKTLRKVFDELSSRVPKDLLKKELWCSSATISNYYEKSRIFSHSVAVSSVVGWLIGLGDRHIGNILLDFKSGEVVHIDYNLCFEKGLKLRIPEIVPFRLTKTMQYAMGLIGTTKTKGHFDNVALHTLNVLKQHWRLWIQLFGAFIYDPISEWLTKASFEWHKRQILDLTMSLKLIASRIGKHQTNENDGTTPTTEKNKDTGKQHQPQDVREKQDLLYERKEIESKQDRDVSAKTRIITQREAQATRQAQRAPKLKELILTGETLLQRLMHHFLQRKKENVEWLNENEWYKYIDKINFDHQMLLYKLNTENISEMVNVIPSRNALKSFGESWFHLSVIATRIPPKFAALLREPAIEADKRLRKLIHVNVEISRQLATLLQFYRNFIAMHFNCVEYNKTTYIYSLLMTQYETKVETPFYNDEQSTIAQFLTQTPWNRWNKWNKWSKSNRDSKPSNNGSGHHHHKRRHHHHSFGLKTNVNSNKMKKNIVNELNYYTDGLRSLLDLQGKYCEIVKDLPSFQQGLRRIVIDEHDIDQLWYSVSGWINENYSWEFRAHCLSYQLLSVKFRLENLGGRNDLTTSFINVTDRISITHDLDLKLQLSKMFLAQLAQSLACARDDQDSNINNNGNNRKYNKRGKHNKGGKQQKQAPLSPRMFDLLNSSLNNMSVFICDINTIIPRVLNAMEQCVFDVTMYGNLNDFESLMNELYSIQQDENDDEEEDNDVDDANDINGSGGDVDDQGNVVRHKMNRKPAILMHKMRIDSYIASCESVVSLLENFGEHKNSNMEDEDFNSGGNNNSANVDSEASKEHMTRHWEQLSFLLDNKLVSCFTLNDEIMHIMRNNLAIFDSSDSRKKYQNIGLPLLGVWRLLLSIYQIFDGLHRQHNDILSRLHQIRPIRTNRKWNSKHAWGLKPFRSTLFMEKGVEVLNAILKWTSVDKYIKNTNDNETVVLNEYQTIKLLSMTMLNQYISKELLHDLDIWIYSPRSHNIDSNQQLKSQESIDMKQQAKQSKQGKSKGKQGYWAQFESNMVSNKSNPLCSVMFATMFDYLLGCVMEITFRTFEENMNVNGKTLNMKSFDNESLKIKLTSYQRVLAMHEKNELRNVNSCTVQWINNQYKHQSNFATFEQCRMAKEHYHWIIEYLKKCIMMQTWLTGKNGNENNVNVNMNLKTNGNVGRGDNINININIDSKSHEMINNLTNFQDSINDGMISHGQVIDKLFDMNLTCHSVLPCLRYLFDMFKSNFKQLENYHSSYSNLENQIESRLQDWSNAVSKNTNDKNDDSSDNDDNGNGNLKERKENGNGDDDDNDGDDNHNSDGNNEDEHNDDDDDDVGNDEKQNQSSQKVENNANQMIAQNGERIERRRSMHRTLENRNTELLKMCKTVLSLEGSRIPNGHINGMLCRYFDMINEMKPADETSQAETQSQQAKTKGEVEKSEQNKSNKSGDKKKGGKKNDKSGKNEKDGMGLADEITNFMVMSIGEFKQIQKLLEYTCKYVINSSYLYHCCHSLLQTFGTIIDRFNKIQRYLKQSKDDTNGKDTNNIKSILYDLCGVYLKDQKQDNDYDDPFVGYSNTNRLIYQIERFEHEFSNLQIAVSWVLKHDLKSLLLPNMNQSLGGRNSSSGNVNEVNGQNSEENDISMILLPFYVTMSGNWKGKNVVSDVVSAASDNIQNLEARSKDGFDVIQRMAYKLHGLDGVFRQNDTNLNLKLVIMTGCFDFFKLNDGDDRIHLQSSVPQSSRQQLDRMIDHATDRNRLSKMYEGWSAWF